MKDDEEQGPDDFYAEIAEASGAVLGLSISDSLDDGLTGLIQVMDGHHDVLNCIYLHPADLRHLADACLMLARLVERERKENDEDAEETEEVQSSQKP